jgi:uncharacterized protein (TIGR02231 family)
LQKRRRDLAPKKTRNFAHIIPPSRSLPRPVENFMRARILATLSLFALCLAHPALAAEIDVASRVDAVTLYPDAALVRRVAELDLPAGASRLVFHGLPASVDPASLRIGGQGDGDSPLSLGGIDVRKAPAPTADGAIDAQLRQLRDERDAAQVKIDALAAKQAMMQLYAQTGPDKFADAGNAIKPEDWGKAWDAVGGALARNGEDLRLARAAAAEIDARIKAVEAARPAPAPGGATRDVAVNVEAPAAGKFRLALDYRVSGARWTPAYDARLETGGKGGQPRLELIRRAIVAQRTGEDWSNVDLSIAAFPASGGTQAPQVEPQVIAFYEPPVAMPMAAESMAKSAPAPAGGAVLRQDRAPAVEQQSRVEAGAYHAIFHAPGRVSLSMDGESKNIRLSTQTPHTELAWRVSPARDPRAFLTAHFVNDEEAPLLPGAMALYRDGAFVGQSFVKLLAPSEAGDLGFGADDRVSVVRTPVKRKENEPTWFGQTKVETREFKTVLRNLHEFPIRAVVTDQTPFSENAAITVETLPQTTPPSETAPDGKRGLLVWRFDLAPANSKEIRLAYRMKWPADREVVVP